jgi:hypothetical protein
MNNIDAFAFMQAINLAQSKQIDGEEDKNGKERKTPGMER